MALRLRRFKEFSRFVPKLFCDSIGYQPSSGGIDDLYLRCLSSVPVCLRNNNSLEWRSLNAQGYSTSPKISHEPFPELDFLSFIQFTMNTHEGCSHHWLNKVEGCESFFKKNGIFLIVAG